ncbi:MAG TPA: ABC transporter, partial [Gammaproteobacteria bacterium]|nr:ABC transporter [Gammaproteobacteria bacterium]
HYLEEAERLCRNIGIIDQGLLVENTSMRGLLRQLSMETFVLDLEQPVAVIPDDLAPVSRLLDECTLEIDVNRSDTLNQIYSQLSAAGIRVRSMRNKSNRLEQLFINLVGQSPVRANGK